MSGCFRTRTPFSILNSGSLIPQEQPREACYDPVRENLNKKPCRDQEKVIPTVEILEGCSDFNTDSRSYEAHWGPGTVLQPIYIHMHARLLLLIRLP